MTEHSRNKIHLCKLTLEKTTQCGIGKDAHLALTLLRWPLVPTPRLSAPCSLSHFSKNTATGTLQRAFQTFHGALKPHVCQVTFSFLHYLYLYGFGFDTVPYFVTHSYK